jgi:hypothetical protein
MRRVRRIVKPKPASPKPVFYHGIGRVVNREFVIERSHS